MISHLYKAPTEFIVCIRSQELKTLEPYIFPGGNFTELDQYYDHITSNPCIYRPTLVNTHIREGQATIPQASLLLDQLRHGKTKEFR